MKCKHCPDWEKIKEDVSKNAGYCNGIHAAYNLDDMQRGGVAFVGVDREGYLVTDAEFGCDKKTPYREIRA